MGRQGSLHQPKRAVRTAAFMPRYAGACSINPTHNDVPCHLVGMQATGGKPTNRQHPSHMDQRWLLPAAPDHVRASSSNADALKLQGCHAFAWHCGRELSLSLEATFNAVTGGPLHCSHTRSHPASLPAEHYRETSSLGRCHRSSARAGQCLSSHSCAPGWSELPILAAVGLALMCSRARQCNTVVTH